jgi:hypothetical protein
VAVKILPAELAGDAERRIRFEQEARAASALSHPNIVSIHDIGDASSTLYIAMLRPIVPPAIAATLVHDIVEAPKEEVPGSYRKAQTRGY